MQRCPAQAVTHLPLPNRLQRTVLEIENAYNEMYMYFKNIRVSVSDFEWGRMVTPSGGQDSMGGGIDGTGCAPDT